MKKAMAVATLVGLIITVVGFFVLLIFTSNLLIKANETFHDQICRYSVALHHMSGHLVSLHCPSKLVDIGSKNVKIMGKQKTVLIDSKYLRAFDSSQLDEAAKYAISDQMYRCWDIYGRGEVDILGTNILTENQYCISCADIRFSTEVRGRTISGLDKYMDEHTVAKYGSNMTYKQFLGNNIYGDKAVILWQPVYTFSAFSSLSNTVEQSISTSKEYVIVFMGVKSSYLQLTVGKLGSRQFDKSGVYLVHILPKDELAKSCSYLYN